LFVDWNYSLLLRYIIGEHNNSCISLEKLNDIIKLKLLIAYYTAIVQVVTLINAINDSKTDSKLRLFLILVMIILIIGALFFGYFIVKVSTNIHSIYTLLNTLLINC
jgi:hypothetical protein